MYTAVNFPRTEPKWLADKACVLFYAIADGRDVLRCQISGRTLAAVFGAIGPAGPDAMTVFRTRRSTINSVATKKILDGSYQKGDEVLLVDGDFREPARTTSTTTTTTQPPRTRGFMVSSRPSELSADPKLLNGVVDAEYVLGDELAHGPFRTKADWELIPGPTGGNLVRLELTDLDTRATADELFTADDLANAPYARFSLYRLWDDLLRERGQRQLNALQYATGSEANP